MLKHTWGCLALVATNGNMKAVKDEGGWKTWKMVENYAEYNEKQLKKKMIFIGARQILDGLLDIVILFMAHFQMAQQL